ncbi:MAG: hypothetical protein ACI92E_001299 [Oceanicoccus sp.]
MEVLKFGWGIVMNMTVLAIDIAKGAFQLPGVDTAGKVV